MSDRFDPRILALIPHRPPMLLINQLVQLDEQSSSALIQIDTESAFLQQSGSGVASVPAWIGVEYMGQTAALIAGYQEQQGLSEPHLGFLMGARKFQTEVSQFELGMELLVACTQQAIVGESLAMFKCTIANNSNGEMLSNALLTVYRRPLEQPSP